MGGWHSPFTSVSLGLSAESEIERPVKMDDDDVAPDNGGEDKDSEWVWVLFEDGSLRYVHRGEFGPDADIKTKPDGSRWLILHPKVPIQPVIKKVEIEAELVQWLDAPRFEARQWQAKPFVKPVSAFMAGLIFLRSLGQKVNEAKAQLDDIYNLIRAGYPQRAIDRLLFEFQNEFPDYRPGYVGLLSLATYVKGPKEAARPWHYLAWFEGSAHPAMQEVFGDPPPDWALRQREKEGVGEDEVWEYDRDDDWDFEWDDDDAPPDPKS
jgi:hypothetical protein